MNFSSVFVARFWQIQSLILFYLLCNHLVLALGFNDLKDAKTPAMLTQYQLLIQSIAAEKRLIITGVFPIDPYVSLFPGINQRIAQQAIFGGSGQTLSASLYAGDGVHLNRAGAAR